MTVRLTREREMEPTSPMASWLRTLRAVYGTERSATLWGKSSRITPAVVPAVFGDGRKLLWFSAIMTRPNYYVVLGDSTWDAKNLDGDVVDAIEEAIEEAFGSADDFDGECPGCEKRDPNYPCECGVEDPTEFPAYHSGGCSWGEIHLTALLSDLADSVLKAAPPVDGEARPQDRYESTQVLIAAMLGYDVMQARGLDVVSMVKAHLEGKAPEPAGDKPWTCRAASPVDGAAPPRGIKQTGGAGING